MRILDRIQYQKALRVLHLFRSKAGESSKLKQRELISWSRLYMSRICLVAVISNDLTYFDNL